MKIGTIGAGEVAQAFAIHLLKAGHEVLLSNSRGPISLNQLVSKLGKGARAVTGLLKGLGFAVIDLGSLREGGRAQQVGNGLAGVDLVQFGD